MLTPLSYTNLDASTGLGRKFCRAHAIPPPTFPLPPAKPSTPCRSSFGPVDYDCFATDPPILRPTAQDHSGLALASWNVGCRVALAGLRLHPPTKMDGPPSGLGSATRPPGHRCARAEAASPDFGSVPSGPVGLLGTRKLDSIANPPASARRAIPSNEHSERNRFSSGTALASRSSNQCPPSDPHVPGPPEFESLSRKPATQ